MYPPIMLLSLYNVKKQMEKNMKNKRGFTIVELVIVIAVIAILAAVLIPTFSGIINKAKENKEIQACRNMNITLASLVGTPVDITVTKQILENAGLKDSFSSEFENRDFYWYKDKNIVCIIDTSGNVIYPKDEDNSIREAYESNNAELFFSLNSETLIENNDNQNDPNQNDEPQIQVASYYVSFGETQVYTNGNVTITLANTLMKLYKNDSVVTENVTFTSDNTNFIISNNSISYIEQSNNKSTQCTITVTENSSTIISFTCNCDSNNYWNNNLSIKYTFDSDHNESNGIVLNGSIINVTYDNSTKINIFLYNNQVRTSDYTMTIVSTSVGLTLENTSGYNYKTISIPSADTLTNDAQVKISYGNFSKIITIHKTT